MSGKLPIDRVREARDAPAIYDEHRERFRQKQAKLEQTNDPREGELPPEPAADDAPSDAAGSPDDAR